MKTKYLLVLIFLLSLISSRLLAMQEKPFHHSPYSGHENRDVAALSNSQIQSLLNGSGMGYALSAELNKYPGPKHVLELQKELGLSDSQLAETQFLFADMKVSAQKLGEQLIKEERLLDELFRSSKITPKDIQQQVSAIFDKESELRSLHLITHLKQKKILSFEQQIKYQQLRGYKKHIRNHSLQKNFNTKHSN